MTSSNAPRIIVTGDYASGKTTFCNRMENPEAPVRTDYGSVTRDQYSISVEVPQHEVGAASSSFVLVDQRQLCSLQRMIFRRAVGLVVIVDATTLYPMFLDGCETPSESRASTQSSMSHRRDSASARGSSQFFPPSGGVPWDSCLIQLVMMWKTVVQDESEMCNERGTKFRLPCAVIFSKVDLLATEDEEMLTAFKSHCRMTCLGKDIRADMVAFVNLRESTPEEIVDLRSGLTQTINKRLAIASLNSRPRRQSVVLNEARQSPAEQKGKKPCCAQS
jgi:hypothetical protein